MNGKIKLIKLVYSRGLCTSPIYFKKIIPKNGKSSSSTQWLMRQFSDPYVEKSKMMNLRCRSAFKLMEIDDKFKFLTSGQVVVDCGAAPGSWTQVAVKRVNADSANPEEPSGVVISIDKQHIYPIEGATIIGSCDFTSPEAQQKMMDALMNKKVDVFLSDMAPNASGIKDMDDDKMADLCYSALQFAVQVCEVNATFLIKMWHSKHFKNMEKILCEYFNKFRVVKPPASRVDSAEIYLLARQFKGIRKVNESSQ